MHVFLSEKFFLRESDANNFKFPPEKSGYISKCFRLYPNSGKITDYTHVSLLNDDKADCESFRLMKVYRKITKIDLDMSNFKLDFMKTKIMKGN